MNADLATQAGTWVGAHALGCFVVLLCLAVAGAWWIGRRMQKAVAGRDRRHVVAALVVIACASTLFVALGLQLGPGSALTRFDQAVSDTVQQQVPAVVLVGFAALTHAGDRVTLTGLAVIVGAALLLARQPLLALGFVGGMATNGLITAALKHFYGRARPLQPPGGVTVHGYSFPSGHSTGSLMACGLLVYLALRLLPLRWHLPALCGGVALGLSVGVSRIVVRAHFPSDVLAGFASATVWLVCCLLLLEAARARKPGSVQHPIRP